MENVMNGGALLQQAASLARTGRLDEAAAIWQAISPGDPARSEALRQLAMLAHRRGDLGAALDGLGQALTLDSRNPLLHYTRGLVRHDLRQYGDAAADFRQALALAPRFFQAWNNLGLVLQDAGEADAARQAFETALSIKPDYPAALNNLGLLWRDMGRHDEAAATFRRLVALQPDSDAAHFALGMACLKQGRLDQAEAAFLDCVRLNPGHAEAHYQLGNCRQAGLRLEEAREDLQRALALQPGHVPARTLLADLLGRINHTDEAIGQYRILLRDRPDSLKAALGAALTLPVIYASVEHVRDARERYVAGLDALVREQERYRALPAHTLLSELQRCNFLLAYQGENDRELQSRYGQFVDGLLRHAVPDLMAPLSRPEATSRRIKVGFASRFFSRCTVGTYFMSWITRLDRARFQVHVYHLGTQVDHITREIRAASDVYREPVGGAEAIARQIRDDALDILVYPELGMDGLSFLLAAMRLAPVQCAGWGHPVSTGLPNVDCFLSCDAMEPEDAQGHYSERLIRLAGLGTAYPHPQAPAGRSRGDFGLPHDRALYLFPQSLFKIHPDNDALIATVLERNPKAALVFFQARHADITRAFLDRLESSLLARGISCAGRLIMLPYLTHEDYLAVNGLCDVMLDCLHWSGGNTSLDALASGLPIVTLPGRWMRGRQSAAMLELAGVPELVAQDSEHYVQLALDLGNDPDLHRNIQARLREGLDRIYDRPEPVRALENTFLQLMMAT